ERPGERLLDVRFVVPDQLVEQLEAMAHDIRLTAAPPVDVGNGGHGGADQAAFPARWREDEAVELRPAVGLGQDPTANRMGEAVDRDPVAGFSSGPAEQLPGALGVS